MQSQSSLLAVVAGVCVLAFTSTAAAAPGVAVDLDASIYHSCAVTDCGDIMCWGRNDYGQASDHITTSGWFFDPPYTWVDVSTGFFHTCGIDDAGVVECWGNNTYGQGDVPGWVPPIWQVAAGGYHTCVLDGNGQAYCNGFGAYGQTSAPNEIFVDITAGAYHTCGLRLDGAILCWGDDSYGQSLGEELTPNWAMRSGEEFVDVEAGNLHTCGLTNLGSVYCWGKGSSGALHPAADDGRWGEVQPGFWATAGDFDGLDAGASGTCALSGNGVECWGAPFSSGAGYTPPAGFAYDDVAIGSGYVCASDTSGSVMCWGNDAYGRATPDSITGAACFGHQLPFDLPWG